MSAFNDDEYEVIKMAVKQFSDSNGNCNPHDLKQAMEDLSHSLQKLKTFQEGLFGQSLIDNLNKQNELIKEQMELQAERRKMKY